MTQPREASDHTTESRATAFAHASEAELARILDFYQVRWEYEPHVYPILWNLDGQVLESFAPDFFLPDLDLYVEMTTLRQQLVRKKNRKLRRLRELYPDIRIKLFYARDFRALMLKYGRVALVDALSGAPGQFVTGSREPEPVAVAPSPFPDTPPEAPEPSLTDAVRISDDGPAVPRVARRSRRSRNRRRAHRRESIDPAVTDATRSAI